MSIFSKIKDAIFGHKAEAATPPPTAAAPAPAPVEAAPPAEVDVEANCAAMPGAGELNWQTSIVDLMKLLGIDSSYANRKELAEEMGRVDYSGSAEDNIWLHKATMHQLAKNGGRVPAQMLG